MTFLALVGVPVADVLPLLQPWVVRFPLRRMWVVAQGFLLSIVACLGTSQQGVPYPMPERGHKFVAEQSATASLVLLHDTHKT